MAKLGEVCIQITDGSHNPPSGVEQSEYLMLSSKNIDDDFITLDSPRFLSHSDYIAENKRTTVSEGDLLMTIVGTIGRVAIVPEELKGICLQRSVAVIKPEREVVNNRYLMYQLQNMRPFLEKEARGVAQKGIYLKQVSQLDIKLPELEHQMQIVKVLDKASKLIFLRRQQLAKLDELVKARFVEMFGDPVKNTMNWEIKPLSELGELNRGVSKARPRNSPELLGGPYPLIQTGEVANAKTYITSFNSTYSEKGLAQSKMWPKGTLCITIAANIAQTSILTFDACFPDSVVGFISRNMTNELFIHYWFSFFQKILDEQAPQVAQKNINLKILSELNVIVPPLSLQNRFAAFVERVDQQKQTIQQSLEKLELMKKALMQEYFG
ncbi:MAG: restriction endonuclease subunit S [Faecalibacterium sp.]